MTKYQMISFVVAVLAILTLFVTLIVSIAVVDYHNDDRCLKGEVMLIDGLGVQTCKADR